MAPIGHDGPHDWQKPFKVSTDSVNTYQPPSSAPQVEAARQAVWSRIIQIAFDRESGCKGNTPYTPPTDSLLDKLILAATAAGRAEIQEAIETKDRAHAMAIDREFAANERAEAAEAQLAERQEAIDRLTRTQTT